MKPIASLLLLSSIAACRSLPDGPDLNIESQDIVVHAMPEKARLMITCSVRASHNAPTAQSHLVFALAPDHAVTVTSVRDEHGRRVGDGAVRALSSASSAGFYTVVPVTLRQALPAGELTDLEFEYAVDVTAAPGGEIVVGESDMITPIGHSDLRRRLNGGPPMSRFPYRLVAHPADPPNTGTASVLWVGMAPGQRQEALDPPLQQIFRVRVARPAVALAYGPYRPIRADSPFSLEIAALSDLPSPRAFRCLALVGELVRATEELLGASDASQDTMRLLPAPVTGTSVSGRFVMLPRSQLLGGTPDSPELLDLLATAVARSQLSVRGFTGEDRNSTLGEGVPRYLALRALEQDHVDVARRLVQRYQSDVAADAENGDAIRLGDVERIEPEMRRIAGEKIALALMMLDQETARDTLARPALDAIRKIAPGSTITFAGLVTSMQPQPSGKLTEFLLQATTPSPITYSFASAAQGSHHRTHIALRSEADLPFTIPVRLWSPWSEATARALATQSQPPLDVDTPFAPDAVVIDPFFLPLRVHAVTSGAALNSAEAKSLIAATLATHGGSQIAALTSLSLRGQGFVYDEQDHRLDVTALTLLRDKKLSILGSTQNGLVGSVVAAAPEMFLTTLHDLSTGDLDVAILRTDVDRVLVELSRRGTLVAHVQIEAQTHRLSRVTLFGDHGNLLGHMEIKAYRQSAAALAPTAIEVALDGRRSPWLSFRGELYREQAP